ncbi:hypothetical protein MAR_020279, partial [Mya arenaria]
MDCMWFILTIAYILFCLPSHQCEGDDVKVEFSSSYINRDTSLVKWWKYLQNKPSLINTTLQRFHTDVQHGSVTLTIRNVTAEDTGLYTAYLRGITCSPPETVLITVK